MDKLKMGQQDKVEIVGFAGREIMFREKDGHIFAQRLDAHRKPIGPSLELK